MSPNDANMEENHPNVIKQQETYTKEFGDNRRNIESLNSGDKVLIKNEVKSNKMDNEFESEGEIIKRLSDNTYRVKVNSKRLIRHTSQLKKLGWGM